MQRDAAAGRAGIKSERGRTPLGPRGPDLLHAFHASEQLSPISLGFTYLQTVCVKLGGFEKIWDYFARKHTIYDLQRAVGNAQCRHAVRTAAYAPLCHVIMVQTLPWIQRQSLKTHAK